MFWPFSTARVAWDLIAVVDPVFTLPLVIACALALRRKRPRPALAAMAFCACYMGVAIVQHGRALAVQRAVIASRGHAADHARVLPTLGTVNGYHSVYVHGGQVQCDAVRVPFWRGGVYRPGQAAPVYTPEGLDAVQRTAADRFTHFADGFVARDPADPAVVADMRYSRSADAFRPFWGIRLDPPRWVAVPADDKTVKQIWRDVIGAGEWHEVP
jgi:inner membrane protein